MVFLRILNILYRNLQRSGLRGVAGKAVEVLKREGIKGTLIRIKTLDTNLSESMPSDPYNAWIKKKEPDSTALKEQSVRAKRFKYKPLISIITPVYNPVPGVFAEMMESVISQTYPDWQLCIADASTDMQIKRIIHEYMQRYPDKIKVRFLDQNLGIAGNSNEAIKMAEGDFLAFVDHDDVLAPFALFEVVKVINEDDRVDVIYSDRDIITVDGRRMHPFFKPDWSVDLLLAQNYLCHLIVIRSSIVRSTGGFREGYEGSQDYDLFLRCTEVARKIVHIPSVLYHWRVVQGSSSMDSEAKPYAYISAIKALQDACRRRGWTARIKMGDTKGYYKVELIPSKVRKICINVIGVGVPEEVLARSISALDAMDYPEDKLKIFCLCETEKMPLSERVEIVSIARDENFSVVLNRIVKTQEDAWGVVFLDGTLCPLEKEWLRILTGWLEREETGVVGGKIVLDNGTVYSSGLLIDRKGNTVRLHAGLPHDAPGYNGFLKYQRNVSAVDMFMGIRRDVFLEVQGFSVEFNHYREVDLCLKVRNKGRWIVYVPELMFSRIYNRDVPVSEEEKRRFFTTWESQIAKGDPFYNINLSEERGDFSISLS